MKQLLRLGLAALALVGAPLAQAWTYNDGDALLIFHKSGYNDVEFDLGNVSQFTSQSSGYSGPVNNWNLSQVTSTYGANLTGVKAVVVATTPSTASTQTAWLTSAGTGATVNDITVSSWKTLLYSTIDGIGTKPGIYGATNNSAQYSLPSTFLGSYEYVVAGSPSGINQTTLPFLGGRTSFEVEQAAPGTFQFWAIEGTNAYPNPEPAATLVGYFTLSTNGLLDFSVGSPVTTPAFSTTLVNQTNNAGTTASFTVAASGGALSYQWQENGTNLTDGGEVSGSATATLTLSNVQDANAGTNVYSVVVANAAGSTTASATLTVIDPPAITTEPLSLTNNAGSTAAFTVASTGTVPSFQWYQGSTPLTDGGNISGSATATLTLTNVQDANATNYSVVLANAAGSVTSSVVSLTVIDAPVITTGPLNATNNAGSTAGFSVAYTGTSPSIQWYGPTGAISGETSAVLTLANVQDANAGSYDVVLANAAGSVTSSVVSLTVIDAPVITTGPSSATNNVGSTATFTVAYTGTSPGIQWYTNGSPIGGATSATLTLNSVQDANAANYDVVLSNAAGSVTSSIVFLTVLDPYIVTAPATAAVPSGQKASFSVTAGGATTLQYQWKQNGTNLVGQTTSTLTLTDVKSPLNGDLYSVIVSDANGSVTSAPVALTVTAKAVSIGTVVNKTVFAGQPVVLTATVTGGEAPTYQWYGPTGAITDATTLVYSNALANFSDAGNYYLQVSDATLSTPLDSNTNTVTVNVPEKISNPLSATIKQGQLFVLKTTVANSTTLAYTNAFQWYSNNVAIPGATFATYTNSTDNTNASPISYTVEVVYGYSDVLSNLTSAAAVITVNPDTTAPTLSYVYPASKAQLTNNIQVINSSFTLTGKATDNEHVSQVFVSLNNGAYQAASVTNNPGVTSVTWGLPVSPVVGTNSVSAYSVDFAGNVSTTNTRSFFFAVPATVTVTIVGDGTVGSASLFDSVTSSNLIGTNQFFVGRAYTLTATAAHDNLFSNWVDSADSIISNSAKFTFTAKTNFDVTANFVTNQFLAVAGTYYGLFSDTNYGVNETNAGWFSATVTPSDKSQTFSAKLFVDGDALSGISGTFDLSGNGTATKQVARKGKAPLTVAFQLNFDGTIGGTIIDGSDNWTSTVSGDLATYSTAHQTPYVGTYNLLVPGFTNVTTGPAGYSYLTVKIAANGSVTASGALADGTAISAIQTAAVSTNGDVPVYAKAYEYGFNAGTNGTIASYAGSLLGWLNFSNSTPSGNLVWWKNATATNAYYTGGFSNISAVAGGLYAAPTGTFITSNLLTFAGGDLTSNITDIVTVSTTGGHADGTTNQLKSLTFAAGSGLVTGTFTNTASDVATAIKALYVPGTNNLGTNIIGGWFLGTDQGGSLLVQPQ